MATPGYIGFIRFRPITTVLPTFPALVAPPGFPNVPLNIAPGNVPEPGGGDSGTPFIGRLREFEPSQERSQENTSPTGLMGFYLGTNTGRRMRFRLTWDWPIDGDQFELDPPDLTQCEYLYVDARIDIANNTVVAFGNTPRTRRFKGYIKLENDRMTVNAQRVVEYTADGSAHGFYYWGPNAPG